MKPSSLPIGVFDSGLGGLTIVRALQDLLPEEALSYYGDTAHLPYGDKSPELVRSYVAKIAGFLFDLPVKAVVIACNTASAVARDIAVEQAGSRPVFDVIGPAVDEALAATRNGKIAIIGTRTTMQSGIYRKKLLAANPDVQVVEKATPLLVPMIEEGWLHNAVSQDVIDAYMSDTGFRDIDTLILGCTHYPLIKTQIESYFSENYAHEIRVIDSSRAVARVVAAALAAQDLKNEGLVPPAHRFFLSDNTAHFRESAALFLGHSLQFETAG